MEQFKFKKLLGLIETKKPQRAVFDWVAAAKIIKEEKAESAIAGLNEDQDSFDSIYLDNEPLTRDESQAFLRSMWATPVLVINGHQFECFKMVDPAAEEEFWPEEAIKILKE